MRNNLAKKVLIQRNVRQRNQELNKRQIEKLVEDPQRAEVNRNQKKVYSKAKRNFSKKNKHQKNRRSLERPINPALIIKPFVPPTIREITTPSWFHKNEPIQVSVIVPLYRSKECMIDQVKNWPVESEGVSTEIIYVDDCCPEQTYTFITQTWEQHNKIPVGKIIKHEQNAGFGPTCNTGANAASGEYLIFLNADTTVTPGWIKPLVDRLNSDPRIGLVGNLQLSSKGIIDSAGSEWSWKRKSFLHIGRNTYLGQELIEPIRYNKAPRDLLKAGPRDMVTGACFIIRKDLFKLIGQFDVDYRIGYWEDSDLCMKIKDVGLQIWYEPKSIIYHKVGQSKAGGHPYKNHNREVFKQKWIDNYKVDRYCSPRPGLTHIPVSMKENIKQSKLGKIVGCVIALNEEEFLEASVESAAPIVDEWFFVIGGNEYAFKSNMCTSEGYPKDNTLHIARKLAQKYNGTVIEPPGRLWQDKVEMRNAYAKHLRPGDWMFMLDGDEVYKEHQLWRVTELMLHYEVLIMQFWLFWNNVNTIGTGKWDHFPQERMVKWRDGYGYRGRNHLHVTGPDNIPINKKTKTWRGDERLFYHYSWVRPIEKIRQKLDYYKYQSGNDNGRYVDDVFLRWREKPEVVRGRTHPMGGGDWAIFGGTHPIQVQRLIDQGKLDF